MKKLYLGIISLFVVAGFVASGSHHSTSTVNLTTTPAASQTTQQTTEPTSPTPVPATTTTLAPSSADTTSTDAGTSDTDLSNNNTYTNVDGNTVHSPADSTDGSIPVGATATCVDGTYSFSQHHSGTCSHHGGVAQWL